MRHRSKIELKNRGRAAKPAVNLQRYYAPIGLALILVTTFLVYRPALSGTMLWDDDAHITKIELQSLHGLARIWLEPGATQQYYPFLHSAFWVEHKLWGESVTGYHVVNVLLHMTSAVMLYVILQRLRIPGALLATAIFALHPVMVESVAWISEQKNTLSAVFYLSAMLVYLGFDESRQRGYYVLALAFFVLGLLTKTVTATLPAALLVIFWWQRGTLSWKRDVLPLVPFFTLGAVGGLMTAYIERTLIGAEGADFNLTFIERGLLAGRVVCFYVGKLVWPVDLIFIYPRWEIDPNISWQWLFPIATMGALIALWALHRIARGPLACGLFFVGTLLPVLGFLNVYPFIYSFVADHFQYLASLGMIVLVSGGIAVGIKRLPQPARWVGIALGMLLVCILSALSFKQCGMYVDPATLYETTIARDPNSWWAHNNLGSVFLKKGNNTAAMEHFRIALHLKPDCAEAHSNLGFALTNVGRISEALEEHRAALVQKPDHPLCLTNLSITLISAGRQQEAVEMLQAALLRKPNDPILHKELGSVLAQLGRYQEATDHFTRALELLPEYGEAHLNLGSVLAYTGMKSQAIEHVRRSLEINPNSVNGHNNLGVLLVSTGETTEAIFEFQQALRLAPDRADIHNSLGEALRQAGRLQEAIEHYQATVRLQPNVMSAYGNLAQSLAAVNHPTDAIATAEKAIQTAHSFGIDGEATQIKEWLTAYRAELHRGAEAATSGATSQPQQPAGTQ